MAIPFYPSITAQDRDEPFALQVARGMIPGHTSLNISGFQAAVSATFVPVWELAAEYVYPVAAAPLLLYSSSASDTAVSVVISGLDAAYGVISETLVLTNGTAGVTTANSYLRVTSLSVTGTNNPVGDISLSNADKSATYARVIAGTGRSSMTIYTVPADHTFYLAKVNCYSDQSNNQITNYRSWTRNASGIVTAILQAPFTQNYTSEKSVPRGYPAKTDIQWQCKSSAVSQVGLQIEGILIKGPAASAPGIPRA